MIDITTNRRHVKFKVLCLMKFVNCYVYYQFMEHFQLGTLKNDLYHLAAWENIFIIIAHDRMT